MVRFAPLSSRQLTVAKSAAKPRVVARDFSKRRAAATVPSGGFGCQRPRLRVKARVGARTFQRLRPTLAHVSDVPTWHVAIRAGSDPGQLGSCTTRLLEALQPPWLLGKDPEKPWQPQPCEGPAGYKKAATPEGGVSHNPAVEVQILIRSFYK